MKAISKLPEDIIHTGNDIAFYIYSDNKPLRRSKIEFSKNVLCLLMHGQKEIYHANFHKQIDNSQYFLLQAGKSVMVDKAQNQQYQSILLFFSNDFLLDFCLNHDIKSFGDMSEQTNDIPVFRKDDFIINYANSLQLVKDEYLNNKEFKAIKLNEIFNYMLMTQPDQLLRFIYGNCLIDRGQISLMKTVDKYKSTGITIKELSFLCNMSVSTFNRRFEEVYATTPKKYFIDCRMRNARRLLLNKMSLSDISENLGYQNLSTFSREFKKYFGLSPKEYLTKTENKF